MIPVQQRRLDLFKTYLGFEISVGKVPLVHGLQGLGNLSCNGCCFRLWKRALVDVPLEVAVLDEFHGDIQIRRILEPTQKLNKAARILDVVN